MTGHLLSGRRHGGSQLRVQEGGKWRDPTRPEEEEEEEEERRRRAKWDSGAPGGRARSQRGNRQDTEDGATSNQTHSASPSSTQPPAVPQEPPTGDGLRPEATSTADTTASSDSPFDETTSPPSTTDDEASGNEESEQVSEDNETSPAPDDEDEEAQTLGESGDASTTEFYGAFATEELQSVTTGSTQIAADDQDEEMQTERPDEVPRPGNTSVFLESQTTAEGSLSTSEADQDTSEYQEAETESEQPPDSLFSTTPEGPSIPIATVSPEDPFPEELPAPPDSEALQDTDAPAVTVVADSHDDNATLSPESAFTEPTIYEEPDSTTASSEPSTSEGFTQVTTDTSQVTIDYQNDEMEEQPEETTTSNTPEESLGVTVSDFLESLSTEGLLSGTTDPNQITSDYPNDAISTTQAEETTLPTMSEASIHISTTTSPENRPTPFDSEPLQATDAPVIALSTDSHSDYDTTQFPDAESTNEPQQSTPLDEGLKIPVTEVPSSLLGQEEKETQHQQEDPSRPYVINSDICGFKGVWNHLVKEPAKEPMGGVAVSTVEFCWVAALVERRGGTLEYLCSGALVEADLVLTAASCLRKLNTSDLYRYIVVLGDSNLREDLPYGVQFHSLAEVVIHPAYSSSEDVHANDIGERRGIRSLSQNTKV
nr:mucin-17-like [Penaeus vannamei]